MRPLFRQTLLFLLPLLAACSNLSEVKVTNYLHPYRIDINQGNYLTQDMVSQLKPGQSKDQVRFILGSPLIVDSFHGGDRWDYLYRLERGTGDVQTRRLVVFFADGKLSRVGGDVAAGSAADLAAPAAATAKVINIDGAPAAAK